MTDVVCALVSFAALGVSAFIGVDRLWKRVVAVVGVAATAAVLTGALAVVVPGDPVAAVLGEDASDEARAALAAEMGLDDDGVPGWLRPLRAGGRIVTGLFSPEHPLRSFRSKEPVVALIAARLPRTLALGGLGIVVGVCFGVGLGAAAALTRRAPKALLLGTIAVLAALPRFVLGPALILVAAIGWRLVPAGGVDDGWRSWVLPVSTLALPFAGVVARHVRAAVDEALAAPFARSARARGVSFVIVVVRHALPHALLPVVHLTALQAGVLASGAVVVEKVFSFPGLGLLLQESLKKADLPVVQGIVVVAAAAIAGAGLVADLVAGFVDPRLRPREHGRRS